MKCPVCGAVYHPIKVGEEATSSSSLTCRRCKVDLSDLIRLHDQAIWHHRQALYLFSQGRYSEAQTYNNSAIALHYSNADFHALAGKLAALQGEFQQAISEWRLSLKFDPQNVIASNCLQMIELMSC
jgi:tetratricopeptide (TPR) repeat protein